MNLFRLLGLQSLYEQLRSFSGRFHSFQKNRKMLFLLLLFLLIIVLTYYFSNKENFDTNDKIRYYVITLHSQDRLENIRKQQEKLKAKIELFDGIIGKNLKNIDIQSSKDPVIEFTENINLDDNTQDNTIKKNEIGCYLSHYYLYKKIAQENTSSTYSVIFEDDFIINNDFENELNNALSFIDDFDIIYLYLHGHTETEKKTNNICIITEDTGLFGTGAYIINNKNINKLINETKIMKTQIDVQLQNIIRSKKLKVYKFCPYIVNISGLPSTIQTF